MKTRIIALILACLMVISTILTGCISNSNTNDPGNLDDGFEDDPVSYKYTDSDLIKESTSEYRILVSDDMTSFEATAFSEFNTFFYEATGVVLEVVSDSDYDGGKFISLGETQQFAKSGITINKKELTTSGYIVKTLDDNVYINGGEYGVVYGVYDFLEKQFGYKYFDSYLYTIEKGVENEKLIDFDVKFIPSIEYRSRSYGFQNSAYKKIDEMYDWRMRFSVGERSMVIAKGSSNDWHNFFAFIPKATYQADHPEWYSPDGYQLCLTRDLEGLAAEMAKKVIEQLEKQTNAYCVHIGMQDTRTWCNCEECTEVINRYGGYNVVTYIFFMQKVAELLKPWHEEHPDRVVNLSMFSYHATQEAPVKYNEKTGEYDLISEDLVLPDNVFILYAPIRADYYMPFSDPINTATYTSIMGWSKASKNLLLWTYMQHFSQYQVPFWNFNSIKENMQLLSDCGTIWLFNQAAWNSPEMSAFSHIKAYVSAELSWNCNQNVDDLIKAYCDAAYGPASDIIQELVQELGATISYAYHELNYGNVSYNTVKAEYYPYAVLQSWMDKYDEAFALIEGYKTTAPEKYQQYYDAILLETMTVRYMLIHLHSSYFTESELLEMMYSWKEDAIYFNFTLWNEHDDIQKLWDSWGI